MDNNLNEKDLIIKVQEIWFKNKKSRELIKYFEILLSKNQDVDAELYLIYLNTLVNLGKHNQALLEIEHNQIMNNAKEIVAFKIKLLFFLKKYKECENYIKNTPIDEDNRTLAQRTLKQIKEKLPKKEEIKTTLKNTDVKNKVEEQAKTNEEKVIIESKTVALEKKEINSEVKKEVPQKEFNVSNIENKKSLCNKSKSKIIIPIIVAVVILMGAGIFFITRGIGNDIAIETFINIDNNDDLNKYKSNKSDIQYKLPIGMEFEFVSSVETSNQNKEIYVTYKVSDENIATITEDGFFKAKKEGIVDIQTLNKKKVVDTITVEISNKEIAKEKTSQEDINNQYYELEIQEFLKNYEKDYIKAVNKGNYKIIEKYLVKDAPLYKEHSANIKDLYEKGITERLESLQFLPVDKISDNEYLVNVKETIVIIKKGEEEVKEFDSFYSVIKQANGEYLISEIQIRAINEISSSTDEISYRDKEAATKRAKEIVKLSGVDLLNSEDELVDYDGRKCWQFYIGMGDARVEYLHIDIDTGEFKESINPSLDWRYEW